MGVHFKPSEVRLDFPSPFIATFGRVEHEATAALMVLAMQRKGDTWDSVVPRDCGEAIKDPPRNAAQVARYFGNPFVRLDFNGLVGKGFAEWEEGTPAPIRFTNKGIEAISRFTTAREG